MHTLDTAQRRRSVLSFPLAGSLCTAALYTVSLYTVSFVCDSTVCTMLKMSLPILSYNIAGLLPKLDNVAFVNYITSFDLVCLIKIYVASEFESNLFKDFGVFVAN